MEDVDLVEKKGIVINTAVLHVLDYKRGVSVLSKKSLNQEDDTINKYVKRMLNKMRKDIRLKKGTFNDGSLMERLIGQFTSGEYNFTDFSIQAVSSFNDFLKEKALQSYDVLMIYYQEEDVPAFAMALLANQPAYTHQTEVSDGLESNTILLQNSVLPAPTKKIDTFAVVNLVNKEVQYVDDTDWDQPDFSVMRDVILNCSSGQSKAEILDQVSEITSEIAEEYEENPSLMLSKVKNYIHETVTDEKPLKTEDLAIHVFNDSEEMQNSFISKSAEKQLPEEIEVPKSVSTRKMKNQKIKTDTGIEITFPTEYFENPDFIEFVTREDGTLTIEIKRIGKIENKG